MNTMTIDKLKKENEQLIYENEQLKNDISEYEKCIPEHYDIAYPHNIENIVDELESKNEFLKQYAMKVHNFAYGTEFDDPDIVESFDFDEVLGKLEEDEAFFKDRIRKIHQVAAENEQLKAKLQEVMAEEEDGYATSEWFNEKVDFYIKYQINHEDGEHSHFFHNGEETLFDVVATLEELRDQIKTLQYQNDMEKQCHEREFGDLQSDAEDLRTEVQDLKEELSTVEKHYAELQERAHTEEQDYSDDLDALRSEHEGQLEDMEAEYEEKLQEKDDEHAEEIQEKDEYIKSLEEELEKLTA